ncbi:MAG: translocation/assembly module TamB domain-containing protein [Porphyromonadaceae bacterium]|nr:translocation/assembly module TamB domain-containing protein [Porphyromonadaceae bacterium]
MLHRQVGKKTLNRLRIVRDTILVLAALYFLPSVLLLFPGMQRRVGGWVASSLSSTLGTPVDVGRVDVSLWTRLEADDLLILSDASDTIISARRLQLGFDLLESIRRRQWCIGSIQLFAPRLRLVEDPATRQLNLAPIIEALSSGEGKSDLALSVGAVVLRDADVQYLQAEEEVIRAEELHLRLSRLSLTPSGYSAIVDELSGRLSNGFRLSKLTAELAGWGDYLRIKNLNLRLPQSELDIPVARLNISGRGIGLIDTLNLASIELSPGDISPLFSQPIDKLPSAPLRGTASLVRDAASGRLSSSFDVRQRRALHLRARAGFYTDTLGRIDRIDLVSDSISLGTPWLDVLPQLLQSDRTISPSLIGRLGDLNYRGRVSWGEQLQSFSLDGRLGCNQGQLDLRAGLAFDVSGTIRELQARVSTEAFELSTILGDTFPIGTLAAEIDLGISRSKDIDHWHIEGLALIPSLTALGYTYRDLSIQLTTDRLQEYRLQLTSEDPNALLSALVSGRWDGAQLNNLSAQVDVRGINPTHLGLESSEQSRYFSGQARVGLSSIDLEKATGELAIPSFMMVQQGDTLHLEDLRLRLDADGKERYLRLTAPWLSLSLSGKYSPTELPGRMLRSLYRRVPVLHSLGRTKIQPKDNEATLRLHLSAPPRHLDRLLALPLHLHRPLDLLGRYEEYSDRLFVSLDADSLELANHRLSNFRLRLDNNSLDVEGNVNLLSGGMLSGFNLGLRTQGDALSLRCDLGTDEQGQENGVIALNALLGGTSQAVHSLDDLRAEISLYPSSLRIHSAIWELKPARILLEPNRFSVDNLQLSTKGRSLRLFGSLGAVTDELWADMKNINLRYILESAGVDFTMLETDLTGRARANFRQGVLYADAKVTSPHFLLEGRDAAAIDIALDWNSRDMKLNLAGIVHQNVLGGSAKVGGYIKIDEPAGIDLMFDAKRLDIGFTHVFMQDILSRLEGAATGRVRLFGRFEQGVTLAGVADVQDGKFGLGIIGTEYAFSDRVRFEPNRIVFDRLRIRDNADGTGVISGHIGHDHFADINLQLRADELDKICILHTSHNRDLPIYGKAYASGSASLVGNEQHLSLGLDIQSEAKTDVTLDFNTVQVGRDLGIMRFKPLSPSLAPANSIAVTSPSNLPLGISMSLNIGITPEAKIGMLMGYDGSGGELRGKAQGHLAIQVTERGEANVFGGLAVVDGQYTFRLEQLAQKRFALAEGGEVTFRGPIESTELNLKAIYSLTANIADLDADLLFDIKRTNVPVHCVLGLTGSIIQPKIRFGIELPGMDVELERRVRSLLNTDDAVMRQMLYLITLGKFYTLDSFLRNSQSTTNNLTSVASSAISEQLSYLLGGLSEKISIGTSIKTRNAEFNDTDIELLLSGSLFDDRLLISANVGYHDNPYLSKTYIGEFDLEYKLNKSGSFRLKGYNHYNHMYQYLRQGLTIQGLGISFRQRFGRLSELFAPGRSRLYPRINGQDQVTKTWLPSSTLVLDSLDRPSL